MVPRNSGNEIKNSRDIGYSIFFVLHFFLVYLVKNRKLLEGKLTIFSTELSGIMVFPVITVK